MKRSKLWKREPEATDFAAAASYLALLCGRSHAQTLVRRLRHLNTVEHAAKDLLRASGLALLPRGESHVKEDLKRIRKGKALSPVLLVQGDMKRGVPLRVADGYHRICAVYYHDEDAPVACRVVSLSRGPG